MTGRRLLWVLAAISIPLGFALLEDPTLTTVVNRAVGGSFIVCGLIVWQHRPDTRTGALMTLTGFLYLGGQVLGALDWPPAHTVGEAFAVVWLAAFGAVVLGYPSGRLVGFDRVLVGAWIFGTLVWQLVWMLFLPGDENVLAVWPDAELADTIDTAQRTFNTTVGATVAVVGIHRWLRAAPALRQLLLPLLAGVAAVIVLAVQSYYRLITGEFMRPTQELTAFVLFLVPLAFLVGMLRAQLARAGMADLIVALQRAPDTQQLGAVLARTLRDPSLELVYWLPGFETYIDEDGRPCPPPADGRVLTPIEHDGEPVAALVHDAALTYEPELLALVCAAADVALAHTRLVQELTRSRVRLVEAGDEARRKIERDLHDGAQQRLVSLAIALRLTEDRLKEDPDAAASLVAAAREELKASLEELRELARGIHPAVLEHGLATALNSLAVRSPTPARVTVELDEPLPEAVELALYFVASEGLANVAKYAQAHEAEIHVTRAGDVVVIEVADDGIGGADGAHGSGLRGLADRVEAFGGRLRVTSPPGGGTRLHAELPCDASVASSR
ncbi:histidine kinase [Solirubrobacter phytolaccae]|uniref:histidine kinase n=1 Tax=Solirubrobacter phytolaccae TaxID=1404360 RepID=A0A9X3NLQ0_9ACTN|nr:histidine kinase [Solirubrobacter phytolaccae]MDA0183807.1 histidine kinase [Solirubrobacter phytolaccae]